VGAAPTSHWLDGEKDLTGSGTHMSACAHTRRGRPMRGWARGQAEVWAPPAIDSRKNGRKKDTSGPAGMSFGPVQGLFLFFLFLQFQTSNST
jgi:hypothetical protein